jgi:DNA-binding response OmpR family regulator
LDISRETVLIVDDDTQLRHALKMHLSVMGYSVLAALDGEEALNICKKENLSLIICVTRCPETRLLGGKD